MPGFAKAVFERVPGFRLSEASATECDVHIYSHYGAGPLGAPTTVQIFLDGESSSQYSALRDAPLTDAEDAHIYIGPRANHAALRTRGVRCVDIPFASLSFAERTAHSPRDLLVQASWAARRSRRFCAYMYANPLEEREAFFRSLRERAAKVGLHVDALGPCMGSTVNNLRLKNRGRSDYLDESVRHYRSYDFVIAYENEVVDGYVTEKIVSAYLAGSVPIYHGSRAVLEYFSPDSLVFVPDFPSVEDAIHAILEVARDRGAIRRLVEAKPLNPGVAGTTFSWHRSSGDSFLANRVIDLTREVAHELRLTSPSPHWRAWP